MIITLLLDFIALLATVIMSIFPIITKIPMVDSYLVGGFSWWTGFLAEIPPLQIMWTCTLAYLTFKATLMLVKLFFGHRINI
jgi:hypothetical protein